MADNDVDNEDSELSEHREAQVSAWMNHTYFYNAYVCGRECQFDKSFDRDICQLSSDLWSIRSWRSNPPRWYSERRLMSLQFDLTTGDDDDIAAADEMHRMSLVENVLSSSATVSDAEPMNLGNAATTEPAANVAITEDMTGPRVLNNAASVIVVPQDNPNESPHSDNDNHHNNHNDNGEESDDDNDNNDTAVQCRDLTTHDDHGFEENDDDNDNIDTAVQPGHLTTRDDQGHCQYVNTSLDLEIQVSGMHWDVSAGYTKDVCDVFYWHVDQILHRQMTGIPFVVPQALTLRTLNAFAKLFHFNKDGEGMTFYRCGICPDSCPEFSCYAHMLFHMELSNMVGCEEALNLSITHGYPWNTMPGYLIDNDVLCLLERTIPCQNRQHNLVVGNKPPCRFEQRACLTFQRAWHHEKANPFYLYLHTKNVLTNHKEGNMEYLALSKNSNGLEMFAQLEANVQKRVFPLREEYPHVYKMPFILDYAHWPPLAQHDFGEDIQRGLRSQQDDIDE